MRLPTFWAICEVGMPWWTVGKLCQQWKSCVFSQCSSVLSKHLWGYNLLLFINIGIWRFPEIGLPPKTSISTWDSPWQKPSILGYLHDYGNPHVTVHMTTNMALGFDENSMVCLTATSHDMLRDVVFARRLGELSPNSRTFQLCSWSQMLHVWYIYLHLGDFWGKCR